MGKAALDGQPGIITVEKGWQNLKEINRVVYDPATTDLMEIERVLQQSGTYRDTLPQKE
ncbi:MAG: hypothetical protein WBB19_02165 [Desulforhopalus sp.]